MGDVIERVPKLGAGAAYVKQAIRDRLIDHKQYVARYGEDLPNGKRNRWHWTLPPTPGVHLRSGLRNLRPDAPRPGGK